MDAKNKAEFINSVAGGKTVPCPKCNTANNPNSKFCKACGTKLARELDVKEATAFSKIIDDSKTENRKFDSDEDSKLIFADGLPAWDIVPPQIMVRRR